MQLSAEHFFEITGCKKVEAGSVAHPKRQAGRVGCAVRAQFQRAANGKPFGDVVPVRIRDVSMTGACLLSRIALEIDDQIGLAFERRNQPPLKLICVVTRREKAGDNFLLGVRFEQLVGDATATPVTTPVSAAQPARAPAAARTPVAAAAPVAHAAVPSPRPVSESSEVERIRRAVVG